jgi:hypothetical protein
VTRDIDAAEELTINYLPEHGAGQVQRQQGLSGYGFTCGCPACDMSTVRGRDGERRRVEMQDVLRLFAEAGEGGGAEKELEVLERFIEVFREEGIAGRELSTM